MIKRQYYTLTDCALLFGLDKKTIKKNVGLLKLPYCGKKIKLKLTAKNFERLQKHIENNYKIKN
jgi:hypothetical protein